MSNDQIKSVVIRFLKGFVAGGVASAAAVMAAGVSVSSVEDLKKFGFAVVAAFITGGLLSIDKLTREYFKVQM